MTLNQWTERAPVWPRGHGDQGAMYIAAASIPDDLYPLLWSLEDYRVTSVHGGSVWLMRREGKEGT